MIGTIKKVTDRGFGFIESSESENDVFFHSTALKDVEFTELKEGDEVTFEIEETEKGTNAVGVSRA